MAKKKQKRQATSASVNGSTKKNDIKGGSGVGDKSDWISKLVQSSVRADHSTATSNSKPLSSTTPPPITLSKEERQARRAAKKARRNERKEQQQQQQQRKRHTDDSQLSQQQATRGSSNNNDHHQELYQQRLHALAGAIRQWRLDHPNSTTRCAPYVATNKILHGKRKWDEAGIQPRARDYGGIGLARPSLWIEFDECSSWQPRLEEEFAQHVPGFFGKQRTKAMKKQLNANMLWKRMLEEKQQQSSSSKTKKKRTQSPEERAQVMMEQGLV